jgi:hypothetical protein
VLNVAADPKPSDEKEVFAPYMLENNTEIPVTVEIGYLPVSAPAPLLSPATSVTAHLHSPTTSAMLASPALGPSSHAAAGAVVPAGSQLDHKHVPSSPSSSVAPVPAVRIVSAFEVPAYSQKPFFFKDANDGMCCRLSGPCIAGA